MAQENKSSEMAYGFPRHDIPPQRKKKKWHLEYSRAFHNEFTTGTSKVLRWASKDYEKWRLYARGKQPIDQYKELLGMVNKNGKLDHTWRNLDYNILSIFPRFKTVIKNRLLKQPRELILTAIDQTSVSKERRRKAEMVDYIANRQWYEEKERQIGVNLQKPFEPGEPVPENSSEIDIHLQMYPKNKYIMYMKDQIDLALLNNDWKQIEENVMDDLIDIGVAGTRTWVDINGAIRITRVLGERMISNTITENDFSDQIRIGFYEEVTISQLRASVPRGTFSEQDLATMASRTGTVYDIATNAIFFEQHQRFPYDHEKVQVLRWECFSADDEAYVLAQTKDGNPVLQQKDNPYWLGDKTDKQYEEYYKKLGEKRKVMRDSQTSTYQCSWIVDTDIVFNYGPVTNQLRYVDSLREVESSYTMYTLDFDSIIRQCEPILDNIQLNWLQYQHHLAQSKPKGLAIEKRALGMVDLGGGKKLTSGQILKMYSETGSYIYTGTDQWGKPYPFKPLEELQGGISEAAKQHLDFIIMQIDLLRGILGLNEATDASSVDPKLGKAVSEMVQFNTNNALGTIYHAFTSIYERTARKVAMLVPDAESMPSRGRIEALGEENAAYMWINRDLPFMSFGIKIEAGMTDDLRMRLTDHLNAALKTNGGVLLPEDTFMIENEPNLQRAYLMLSQKSRQREQAALEAEMMKMDQQAKGNTETAVAVEQEKQKTMEVELSMLEEKTRIETEAKIAEIREKAQWDIILKKIETGAMLTAAEIAASEKLMSTEIKVRGEIQKAKLNAQAKEKEAQNNMRIKQQESNQKMQIKERESKHKMSLQKTKKSA